jgi:hypothetical protein
MCGQLHCVEFWTLSSVSPSYADSDGSSFVTLQGTNFIPSLLQYVNISCAFTWLAPPTDNTSYPAAYGPIVSATTTQINCSAPAYPPTNLPAGVTNTFGITLSVDEDAISQQHLPFFYYTAPTINSIDPNNAQQQGIDQMVVQGIDFAPFGADLLCWFGNVSVVAEYLNSTYITCVVPPADPGDPIPFFVSNGPALSTTNVTFQYWGMLHVGCISGVMRD